MRLFWDWQILSHCEDTLPWGMAQPEGQIHFIMCCFAETNFQSHHRISKNYYEPFEDVLLSPNQASAMLPLNYELVPLKFKHRLCYLLSDFG